MTGLKRFAARRPGLVLTLLLGVSAVLAAGALRLTFDSSLDTLTVEGDPATTLAKSVRETFGNEEIGVIALVSDKAFSVPAVSALRDLTDKIGEIDGVQKVLSLANARDPAANVLQPPPLLRRGPVTESSVATLKERALANPAYVPHLLARDLGAFAINIFFEASAETAKIEAADREVESLVRAYSGPGEVHYTGTTHIRVRAVKLMRADLMRFLPLSMLCMMIVLWLYFRSFRAIVLPLFTIVTGVAAVLGIMGWVGSPITLTTLVLPSLLLVIGGSYSVHVTASALEHYIGSISSSEEDEAGQSGENGSDSEGLDAVFERIWSRVGLPILISAFTTAVGFGSLAFHPIPAISKLGIYAVIGIAIMAAGCLIGVPVVFAALPDRKSKGEDGAPAATAEPSWLAGRVDGWVQAGTRFGIRYRYLVYAITLAIVAWAIAGAARVSVNTDFLSAFRPDSDVRVAHSAITEELVGPTPLSIVITGPEPGYFKSVASLRRLRDLQDFLADTPGVDASLSLIDYLDELDIGLQAGAEGELIIDDEGKLVEQTAKSYWEDPRAQLPAILEIVRQSPETFAGVVEDSFQKVRMTVRTSVSGSAATKQLLHDIKAYAATMFPPGVTTDVTGNLVVMSHVSDRVLGGQVESVILAFVVIFAVLALLFLSLRVGFAAMIPNFVPVVVFFGIMGWTGIELNLATSIIAAVALGISVDDTIHYMTMLSRTVRTSTSREEALLSAMEVVGRPVVATTSTLTAGFLVMTLSKFTIISAFGWLSAATMLVAVTTDVILLPAILATVPFVSVWDLVATRLGPSPHRTIPLFSGLGRLGVRLVVLMGNIKSFADGEYIMRKGEPGREMYLLLAGRADVMSSGDSEDKVLAPLARGDVVGEMALLRRSERVADVLAREPVEVLAIDQSFLRRLRNRYPRLAARFFVNIARILSDRLEAANRRLGAVN